MGIALCEDVGCFLVYAIFGSIWNGILWFLASALAETQGCSEFSCRSCSFEEVEQEGKTLEFDLAALCTVIYTCISVSPFYAIGVWLGLLGWGVPFIPIVWCLWCWWKYPDWHWATACLQWMMADEVHLMDLETCRIELEKEDLEAGRREQIMARIAKLELPPVETANRPLCGCFWLRTIDSATVSPEDTGVGVLRSDGA